MQIIHQRLFIMLSINMVVLALSIAKAIASDQLPPESTHGFVQRLFVLNCGQIEARDTSLFNPLLKKGTLMDMVSPCYLIQHENGALLWDTGISDSLINTRGQEVGEGAFLLTVEKTLASQLKEINVSPENIDYLAFSHLHADHTGNTRLFSQSVWLMQKAEQKIAFGPMARIYGYEPDDYADLENLRITSLQGVLDVFGDGSAVIIPTPGHTPGHQSLFINLKEHGPVFLSGDLYHFQLNRDHYGIPVWNDKKTTIQTFANVDSLLEETKATLWIQHDKPQFDTQKKAPDYYR